MILHHSLLRTVKVFFLLLINMNAFQKDHLFNVITFSAGIEGGCNHCNCRHQTAASAALYTIDVVDAMQCRTLSAILQPMKV